MTAALGYVLGPALAALARTLGRFTVRLSPPGGVGEGSGVIWHPDGLVVTNAHVARGDGMRVRLWDGRELATSLLARDPRRDLALLTVPAARLPAAIPGDPERLRAGELVVAFGHPMGVANALAMGVVHQPPASRGPGARWVRADIRLAPGNSGGPLADAEGRVVGINTLVAGGLGYAVPASAVARFLDEAGVRLGDARVA